MAGEQTSSALVRQSFNLSLDLTVWPRSPGVLDTLQLGRWICSIMAIFGALGILLRRSFPASMCRWEILILWPTWPGVRT